MILIKTQKKLIPIMENLYKRHLNTWYSSSFFPNLFYNSFDIKEISNYDVIYTTKELLQKVSLKLYGITGNWRTIKKPKNFKLSYREWLDKERKNENRL